MKVFGIGLSRTGTTSLSAALEMLGYRTVHYPIHREQIERADAATDASVAYQFEELDRNYPGSKFILTLREEESWLDSCDRFFRQSLSLKLQLPEYRAVVEKSRVAIYGTMTFDREVFRAAYRNHNLNVRSYFRHRPNDLLEFQLGDGWPRLCTFLNREIPKAPYPHENRMNWLLGKLPPKVSRVLRTPSVAIRLALHILRLRLRMR